MKQHIALARSLTEPARPCRGRPQLASQFSGWGTSPRKNSEIHIDVSHSRQPLVKGERLVRYEVNTVMLHLKNSGATVQMG